MGVRLPNISGRIAQGSPACRQAGSATLIAITFFFIITLSGRKYGRIAQGSERHSYKVDVAGSNPATPT